MVRTTFPMLFSSRRTWAFVLALSFPSILSSVMFDKNEVCATSSLLVFGFDITWTFSLAFTFCFRLSYAILFISSLSRIESLLLLRIIPFALVKIRMSRFSHCLLGLDFELVVSSHGLTSWNYSHTCIRRGLASYTPIMGLLWPAGLFNSLMLSHTQGTHLYHCRVNTSASATWVGPQYRGDLNEVVCDAMWEDLETFVGKPHVIPPSFSLRIISLQEFPCSRKPGSRKELWFEEMFLRGIMIWGNLGLRNRCCEDFRQRCENHVERAKSS